jgi:methylated-DNA-protein-cysteine methyltransferase-like protein
MGSTRKNASDPFVRIVKVLIRKIPKGRVATYGQIAAYAGNPLGARQVVRVLHASSEKDRLPWHRVINRLGKISLPPGQGYEIQKAFLQKEGIKFGQGDIIDLKRYLWKKRSG